MNRLTDWISQACDALGLYADIGFLLILSDGHEIPTVARILSVGAENGMLVFSSYDQVRAYADEILQMGYGYSVLDAPLPNEKFDLASFRDMFTDWGWSGEATLKPDWMP